MDEFPPSIGIDLGTTYTCVAVCRKGKVDIIPNAQGKRTTPSCVAYHENERIVGDAALQQMARNHKNTVFDVKRLIGMPFKNPAVQSDRRRWAFKVNDVDGKPKIQVSPGDMTKTLWPEEISGAVLEEMKRVASEFVGKEVTSAVITVPAYFNDSQRQATKLAAELADLHVMGMTNEPTAAAIAYGLDNKSDSKINVLIFDMGGGTFDVTVLTIDDAIFNVLATDGDTHLGGQDFTDRLFKHFAAEFRKKTKLDIMNDDRAKYRLRAECEKAKRTLSASVNASVFLDSLYQGKDFEGTITRAAFEQLNKDLLRSSMETVESALKEAKMEKNMIDHVLLIGGSTRIPYIEEMLKKYFTESKICKNINPDEAVAYGAAVQAAFLAGDVTPLLNDFELKDVTPQSLGVEVRGTNMSFLIRKNTKIPVKVWDEYFTVSDNQTEATIKVFEGDKELTRLNNFLGKLQLTKIPPKPAGEAKISVCFEIDSNGVLHVSAIDKLTGNKRDAVIEKYGSMRSEDETKRMKNDADRARKQDKQTRDRRAALNKLEEAILDAKNRADGSRSITMKYLVKECDEMLQWLEENQKTAKIQEITEKHKHLKMLISEVFPGS